MDRLFIYLKRQLSSKFQMELTEAAEQIWKFLWSAHERENLSILKPSKGSGAKQRLLGTQSEDKDSWGPWCILSSMLIYQVTSVYRTRPDQTVT